MNKLIKVFLLLFLTINISAKSPVSSKLIEQINKIAKEKKAIPSNISDEIFETIVKTKYIKGAASDVVNVTLKLDRKVTKKQTDKLKKYFGAEIVGIFDKYLMIKIESGKLDYLKDQDFIEYIRYPSTYTNNNFQSENDLLHSASDIELPKNIKYKGKGIRIAVIDSGFRLINDGIKKQVGNHWKSFSNIRKLDGSPDLENGDLWHHGTATLEIINKIAPKAELFPIAVNTKADFSLLTALDAAVEYNPHIICILINPNLAQDFLDGSSIYGKLVDKYTKEKKIIFITPAGNNLKRHYRGIFTPDENGFHDYGGPKFSFSMKERKNVSISIVWKCNTFDTPTSNFEVYIYKNDSLVKSRISKTDICARLIEFNSDEYKNYNENDYYNIDLKGINLAKNKIIESSEKIPFHIYIYGNGIEKVENFIPQYSIDPNFSVAKSSITVGASYSKTPMKVTDFSSWGSGESGLLKPDFIVPSGFKTKTIPFFSGTSSSVPYATGMIALMLEKNQFLKNNPVVLKNLLIKLAKTDEKKTWNKSSGYGFLQYFDLIK